VAVKTSGDISAELVTGQKIEEHVVTDLDLRSDENRPSLTSSAVADEGQVSSKSTIDEITGGNDIGLWSANIREQMQEYWLKNDTGYLWHGYGKLFLNHVVSQHRQDRKSPRKCTAIFVHRKNHNGEVIDGRSWLASGDRFCNSSQVANFNYHCQISYCIVKFC